MNASTGIIQEATALDISSLSVLYKTVSGRLTALDDVTIKIKKGEFVSIVGPSGCGKTTILRVIAGLLSPTSGLVKIGGMDPYDALGSRCMGVVFQEPVLLEWRTALKNVELPMEVAGLNKKELKERATELLKIVGLGKHLDKYPRELSGGMKQRVSIARALSMKPEVILMDEPFGALDQITRDRLNLELLQVWKITGTTILFVTHSLREAIFLSDRVITLSPSPGRVLRDTTISLKRPRDLSMREKEQFLHYYNSLEVSLEKALRSVIETLG